MAPGGLEPSLPEERDFKRGVTPATGLHVDPHSPPHQGKTPTYTPTPSTGFHGPGCTGGCTAGTRRRAPARRGAMACGVRDVTVSRAAGGSQPYRSCLYTLASSTRSDGHRPCYTPRHLSPRVTTRGRRWLTRPDAISLLRRSSSAASASWRRCATRSTAALAGRGSLVLIGGEAGIGKTALAEALLAEADGAGRAGAGGALLRPDRDAALRAVGRGARPAPRSDEASPCRPRLSAGGGRDQPGGVLRARCGAISPRWRRPARLCSCWMTCTGPTPPPSTCCASSRAASPTCPCSCSPPTAPTRSPPATRSPPCCRSWCARRRAARLDLRPLDAAAIAALVAARYALDCRGSRRAWSATWPRRTEGNALFLGELLRTLEGEGLLRRAGDALGRSATWTARRCRRCCARSSLGGWRGWTPETRRLLTVAAVVGQEVPLALWAAVAESGGGRAAGRRRRRRRPPASSRSTRTARACASPTR